MRRADAVPDAPKKDRGSFEPGSRSDPFDMLAAEHALLRHQLERLLVAAEGPHASAASRDGLRMLSDGLRLHQRREDGVLYPVCERLFGGREGAAAVLRHDHAAIDRLVEALLRDFEATGRVPRARLDELRRDVHDHFAREERVLFPLTAALLSGTESSDLARRLRAGPRS